MVLAKNYSTINSQNMVWAAVDTKLLYYSSFTASSCVLACKGMIALIV
jgi:hypothetical protein